MTTRRTFIGSLAGGLVAVPLAARAQEAAKTWRIGFLEAGAPTANQHFLEAFKRGLREQGCIEGQNVVVVERWADGNVEDPSCSPSAAASPSSPLEIGCLPSAPTAHFPRPAL